MTVLLAPALLAPLARAANPALVAGVEKYLRDDEKAFLAAVLTHADASAQFDAQAPLALKDPKVLTPFLGVWRAKMEAYAEADSQRPNPDLAGTYANYAQLMTPEQRAYMLRRTPTLKPADREKLLGYLASLNDILAQNGGHLTVYGRAIVAGVHGNILLPETDGIQDHYRKDLGTYVGTPIAQAAKRDAAASAAALAALQKADAGTRTADANPATPAPAGPIDTAPVKPPKPAQSEPVKIPPPAPNEGSVATRNPAGGALDQARGAAAAAERGGQVFDGDGRARPSTSGGAVIVPPSSGGPKPGAVLTPTSGDARPNLDAAIPGVPSPLGSDASFVDQMKQMQTGPAGTPIEKRIPPIAGAGIGAVLGAGIGFLFGGPIGALIGLAVGALVVGGAGFLLSNRLFQ